jgi:hypothetical protein
MRRLTESLNLHRGRVAREVNERDQELWDRVIDAAGGAAP